jgi:hypothetical protein
VSHATFSWLRNGSATYKAPVPLNIHHFRRSLLLSANVTKRLVIAELNTFYANAGVPKSFLRSGVDGLTREQYGVSRAPIFLGCAEHLNNASSNTIQQYNLICCF